VAVTFGGNAYSPEPSGTPIDNGVRSIELQPARRRHRQGDGGAGAFLIPTLAAYDAWTRGAELGMAADIAAKEPRWYSRPPNCKSNWLVPPGSASASALTEWVSWSQNNSTASATNRRSTAQPPPSARHLRQRRPPRPPRLGRIQDGCVREPLILDGKPVHNPSRPLGRPPNRRQAGTVI